MFEKREQIEEFFDKIFNSINENAKNQLGCDSSLVENFFRSLKNIKSNNLEVFDKLDSQNSKNYKFPYFINKEISTNFKNELGKIIVLNFDISQELLNAIR